MILSSLIVAAIVTVHPADNGKALINAGMGWTMHYYSNIPETYGACLQPGDSAEWFEGCSTVYLRIPWAYIEPEEGVYNWSALDTPAQRWIERGGEVAFRITCSEDWLEYAIPKWVVDSGARGVRFNDDKCWEPDFVDPIFLAKLENFIKAFAKRYDGNPSVAFVDVGSYGLWGEGHVGMSSGVPQEQMNEDVRKHIDLFVKYFKKTQVVISDDISGSWNKSGEYPLVDYARSRGIGWRDDSILVQKPPLHWFHTDQAEKYWRTMPNVLEHGHYGWCKDDMKSWSTDLLLQAVEEMHASYLSIHGDPHLIWKENAEGIRAINLRLGYRMRPVEISWPEVITLGDGEGCAFEISWAWANAGVAPCYRDIYPCLTIKDGDGNIIAVLSDDTFNLRNLPVGAKDEATPSVSRSRRHWLGRWKAPTYPEGDGEYEVFVSAGRADGTPLISLPLDDNDGYRRYRVGTIRLSH